MHYRLNPEMVEHHVIYDYMYHSYLLDGHGLLVCGPFNYIVRVHAFDNSLLVVASRFPHVCT